MRIFVYEYVTGGGFWSEPGSPTPGGSLLAEGTAMARSVVQDFLRIPDVDVWTSLDRRLRSHRAAAEYCRTEEVDGASSEQRVIEEFASSADVTLLIAPETGGALWQRCKLVEACGGRLLGPDSDFVALASNKDDVATHLQERNVPVPVTVASPTDAPAHRFPLIVKPVDGAGSAGIQFIKNPEDVKTATGRRVEQFVPGTPASVAVIVNTQTQATPAVLQRLTDDGTFRYLGGSLPLRPSLDARARQLALRALDALPRARGYLGVDLVLGDAEDGSQDVVIEINPRLTTSYVGLRAVADCNLAAAMLPAGPGSPPLRFHRTAVEFDANGAVRARQDVASSGQPALS